MKKCKCNERMLWDKMIQFINNILFGILLILSISILIIIIQSLFDGSITILLTKEGVKEMILFWEKYNELLTSWFLITTLFIANRRLTSYIEDYHKRTALEEAKAVGEIRKLLDYNEDNFKIHTALELGNEYKFPIEENKKMIKWYRYLGTIELIGIMLRQGIISDDVFNNQFAYRIKNIRSCKPLMKHIEKESLYWTELQELISRVECGANNS